MILLFAKDSDQYRKQNAWFDVNNVIRGGYLVLVQQVTARLYQMHTRLIGG